MNVVIGLLVLSVLAVLWAFFIAALLYGAYADRCRK